MRLCFDCESERKATIFQIAIFTESKQICLTNTSGALDTCIDSRSVVPRPFTRYVVIIRKSVF